MARAADVALWLPRQTDHYVIAPVGRVAVRAARRVLPPRIRANRVVQRVWNEARNSNSPLRLGIDSGVAYGAAAAVTLSILDAITPGRLWGSIADLYTKHPIQAGLVTAGGLAGIVAAADITVSAARHAYYNAATRMRAVTRNLVEYTLASTLVLLALSYGLVQGPGRQAPEAQPPVATATPTIIPTLEAVVAQTPPIPEATAAPTPTPQPTPTPSSTPTPAATPTPTVIRYAKPEINYALPNTLYGTSENLAGNLAALTNGITSRATGYVGTTVQTLGDLVNRSSKVEVSDTRNEVRLYTSENPIKPAAVVSFSESGIDALISEVIQQKFNTVAFIDSGDYQSMLADQKASRAFASTLVNIAILDRKGQAFVNHDPDAILAFLNEQVTRYGPAQVEFGRDGKTRFRYEGSLDGIPFHTVNSTPEQQRKTFDAAFK